jgi:hypothetical protein
LFTFEKRLSIVAISTTQLENEMTKLKFFYNGVKGSDGKLQNCDYSSSKLNGYADGTITIYGCDYRRFSDEVREQFEVFNSPDSMTDYFDNDRIRVKPDHPLYAQVAEALVKREQHWDRLHEKRKAKWAEARA